MKLAILTTGNLLSDIQNKINTFQEDYSEITFCISDYKNFTYISELYEKLYNDYDGFLVSGLAAYCALEKGISIPVKPTVILDSDLESMYHALLDLLMDNREMDFNRVIIDVLLPQNPTNTAAVLLSLTEPGYEKRVSDQFWRTRSLEELKKVEHQVCDLIIRKWERGEVDYVLSRYSSLLPLLKEKGIPCSFIYPTVYQLSNAVKECVDTINLEQMHEYMPGVITVFKEALPDAATLNQDMDINILELQKALLDFNKEYLAGYQLQKHLGGFHIFTNLKTINRITQSLSTCNLKYFLENNLDFKVNVSYGFAKDIGQASSNAAAAMKMSVKDSHVYAINEAGTLVGPLDSGHTTLLTCDLTPELEAVARRSRLSPLTVQKLKTIVNANHSAEITIAELSEKMGVKQRNANRILANLIQSNDAEISGTCASGTKGRPTKVYRLLCFCDRRNQ